MKFKVGDTALNSNCETVEILEVSDDGFCTVITPIKSKLMYHESTLEPLVRLQKEPTPLKMTLALEETLKEIIHHLNDGNYKLTEQYIAHDYSSINKSHDIKITMVLKENE